MDYGYAFQFVQNYQLTVYNIIQKWKQPSKNVNVDVK